MYVLLHFGQKQLVVRRRWANNMSNVRQYDFYYNSTEGINLFYPVQLEITSANHGNLYMTL